MKPLAPARARKLLAAMRGRPLIVVGDVMLDEFVWGKVARISPEAPVPVVEVASESRHVGGAGNVARNVRALQGAAFLVGVVGRDAAAQRIRAELEAAGVRFALVSADDGRPTTVKTRIIAHQQQIVRTDRECADAISTALADELLARIHEALPSAGGVIVSDYQKGVVTPRVMRAIVSAARRRHVPVLVDPKVRHFALYRRATVVTPNQNEAELASGLRIRSEEDLSAAGHRLLKMLDAEALLITRGEQGMDLFCRGRRPMHVPTFAREVYDVTGAGDTVIATLALALAAGARMPEAAVLANCAAGVVVGKVGTATTSQEELLVAIEEVAARS
jgi:D-glycero-beta-D-manno-heptose-7-phosphate kinase